ncbi:MAG: hypothetical protein LBQ79_00215 [Deltaproteobacteria bacterium]|jgi:hypothetical protein|nr:hypothetical protein [Deltaproteobacteria bacterium]
MFRPVPSGSTHLASVIGAAIVFAAAASQAAAQDTVPRIFRDQPPLTRDDLPAALEIARTDFAALSEDDMTAFAARLGITRDRVMYIGIKMAAGLVLLRSGATEEQAARSFGGRAALPTPEELEVLRGAEDSIRDSIREAMAAR